MVTNYTNDIFHLFLYDKKNIHYYYVDSEGKIHII